MTERLYDWRSRLAAVIEAVMDRPFVWGRTDCAMFGAACVYAITGEDHAAAFRGLYDTRDDAAAMLAENGHADLAGLIVPLFPEIHPAFARAGDIALLPGDPPFGWTVGIFAGERIGVMTTTGYATIARPESLRAFKVG